MEIIPESGSSHEERELRCKPSKRKRSSAGGVKQQKEIPLDVLLHRRCRCVAGACFTQFKGMEKSIRACRDEFRALDGGEKETSKTVSKH